MTGTPSQPPAGPTNVKVSVHVLLAGSRIASVRAANVLYYHRDWQGSVVATTYTGGNVGVKYRYTPYGQLDRTDESISNAANASELGYTGGLRLGWNPSTAARQGDLVLLGARVYDAALKRWLQPDTVDVLRYTYTSGDPVNLVDPTGRAEQSPAAQDSWTGVQSGTRVAIYFNGEFIDSVDLFNAAEYNPFTRKARISEGLAGPGSYQEVQLKFYGDGGDLGLGTRSGGGVGRGGGAGPNAAWRDSGGSPGKRDTRVTVEANLAKGRLTLSVNGRASQSLPFTSGRGACTNKFTCIPLKNEGPVPLGDYTLKPSELVELTAAQAFYHAYLRWVDWGSFYVPLHAEPGTETFGREGFYMHGGVRLGSAGCIDCGGGLRGTASTKQLVGVLLSDSDGLIQVGVTWVP